MSANVPRATTPPVRTATPAEEAWLAQRLGKPVELFLGTITPRDRAERIRARIVELGVEHTPAGRRFTTGEHETYGQLYSRLFGEPLIPTD